MKNFNPVFMVALFLSLSPAWANDSLDCQTSEGEVTRLMDSMKKVENGLYKNIFDLKVNHDGEGKISVFYEKGEPKILKLHYKNDKGEVSRTITFEDLENGKELVYENKDIPGKAIVISKGNPYQAGDQFKFKMSYRSGMPDKYSSQTLDFDSTYASPNVAANGKKFKQMVLSPGINMFAWDGTFKKIEFKP